MISVIIPTYRHRETVRAAVESALAQSLPEREALEVIVVNDGSPDDTAKVLAPLARDGSIRYVEQPNAGQGAARNLGLSLAHGEFVALLDDDDLWPAGKLAGQLAALRSAPEAVLAWGPVQRIDAEGETLPTDPPVKTPHGRAWGDLLEGCWIVSPGQTLIRRSALERVGGFDPAIWGADDWDLYLRLARAGTFIYRPEIALLYRVHEGNASGSVLRHLAGHRAVLAKHPVLPWHPVRAWRRRRNGQRYFLANVMRVAHRLRLAGDLADSQAALRTAAALSPLAALRPEWAVPFVLNLLGRSPRPRS